MQRHLLYGKVSLAEKSFSCGEWRGLWVGLRQGWHPKWEAQEGAMMGNLQKASREIVLFPSLWAVGH